jgi:DtxR family transcriptional regulator, Mn-dependent transcriptional regulator
MAILSQAVEDYLKTIYKLSESEAASTNAIAKALNVSGASVTNMLKRLAEMQLVNYTSYRGVTLTDAGRKIALEVIRHHRLLELYLLEVLGYSWDKVHDEAEYMEHHISEEFEEKIAAMLGNPTHDPHGDPIPTKEGLLPENTLVPLTDIASGETVTVKRVSDESPELLRYLAEIGLVPHAEVQLVSTAPFNGPITLRLGDKEAIIGPDVAKNVFVKQ